MSSPPPKSVLKRGPSGAISDGNYNTKIQIALLEYFNSHGIDIQDPTMIKLLTNIMKHTREEKISTSEKDVDVYYMDLQKIKDGIVKVHPNCKLVTGLNELLLSDDNNHYEKLQQLTEAYEALKHKIKENNTEIKRLQSGIKKLQKKRSEGSRDGLKQAIADNTELVKDALVKQTEMNKVLEEVIVQMKSLLQAIENEIKQLEQFIYVILIITIIYDKSVLHLLIAGPLFSYKDGKTHSTKIREGIGNKHGLMSCNKKLLDLESTLQVADAMYQWREIIDSGKGITDKQIDAVVSGINKRGAPPEVTGNIETLKQVIHLCTFGDNFVNFDPFPQEVKQGSLKKKRTQNKKTNRKKTNRKKTNRKKTNRKKSKKSVKRGGGGLSDDNVATVVVGVFVVLLLAHVPAGVAGLAAFVTAWAVNLVVYLVNGILAVFRIGNNQGSQRSRGRRGSREIQETSSERQRRINRIIKEERKHTPPLMPHLIEKCRRLIRKHEDYEKVRRAEAAAAQRNPSFMLVQTDSAKREQELGLLY